MKLKSNKMMRILQCCFLIGGLLPLFSTVLAQEPQNPDKQSTFDAFKQEILNRQAGFVATNDSLFLSFLAGVWNHYSLFEEQVRKRPKPVEQPRVMHVSDSGRIAPEKEQHQQHEPGTDEPGKIPGIDASIDVNKEEPGADAAVNELGKEAGTDDIGDAEVEGRPYGGKEAGIDFYGQVLPVAPITEPILVTGNTQEEVLAFYRNYLRNPDLISLSRELLAEGAVLQLNDWGMIRLMIMASDAIFTGMQDRVLFAWITLLRNGLDVKVGYDQREIYLLANFSEQIYGNPYIRIGEHRYSIVLFPGQSYPTDGIASFEATYPGKVRPLSLNLPVLPLLTARPVNRSFTFGKQQLKVTLAGSLVEFLGSYPTCELGIYFTAPVSVQAFSGLDRYLKPLLNGKTEIEQVNLLLEFIQTAFPYSTDERQFGKERYLFGDESLYFPYTDCEDRAVLFTRLARRYTGLKAVGLDYPNHVSAGIEFSIQHNGDFIIFEGATYAICDPTYIGAKAGMQMAGMENIKPIIIACE